MPPQSLAKYNCRPNGRPSSPYLSPLINPTGNFGRAADEFSGRAFRRIANAEETLQEVGKLLHGRRYRYSFATKELVDEMMVTIPACGPALLTMLNGYCDFLVGVLSTQQSAQATVVLDLIGLILHIFYSLNCVELPEFFEDHMAEWMTRFKYLLELKENSESALKCKTRVIKNVTLYCEKYASDFTAYLPPFFTLIWSLVEQTTMDSEYDKVNFE